MARYSKFATFIALWQYLSSTYGVDPEPKVIQLMGLFPMTGDALPMGAACVPAINMALDDLNNRSDILPGYHLKLTWKDSMVCSRCYYYNDITGNGGINEVITQLKG